MRRRTTRELGTIIGVVAILAAVIFLNGYMRRGSLSGEYEKARLAAEQDQKQIGEQLLSWNLLRKTKGTTWTGPNFGSELREYGGKPVSLVGFMVPAYEFRAMKEFMLLPLPIQCYFCESPPMRDVVLVQMQEGSTVDLVNEPVLVSGTLKLNEGKDSKYFYAIQDATRGVAEKGGKLTPKSVKQETIQHGTQMRDKDIEKAEEKTLLPAQEPPAPADPAAK